MSGIDPAAFTVLIVDDEPENLALYRRALRGFSLLEAGRGDAALVILAERRVDIVVADNRMPGVAGPELLERARAVDPLIRRVIVSAYADPASLLDAINRGQAERYLVKPVLAEQLRREIEVLAADYESLRLRQQRVEELELALMDDAGRERSRAERKKRERGRPGGAQRGSDLGALAEAVARAKRFARPFSLLVLAEGATLRDAVAGGLRGPDVVVTVGPQLMVGLTETSRQEAMSVRERLSTSFPEYSIRLATLPEDGATLDALMAVAR